MQHSTLSQKMQRRPQLFLLGGLIGVCVFLAVFGLSTLNVTNDLWLRGGFVEKDVQQHYAGWLFYRKAPLSFPLCVVPELDWPRGLSVAFTDSIPLFAAFFRIINGLLPQTFQYFGWFSLICYFMLGGFSALLLSLLTQDLWAVVPGVVLFCANPVMIERTLHHTSLAAQFFIVAALYYYFRSLREDRFFYPALFALNCLAISIHPYFLPMSYAITFAMLLQYCLRHRTLLRPTLLLLGNLLGTLAVGWCFGFFSNGSAGGSASLYGYFAMNLNSLWNPTSCGGTVWSRLIPVFHQVNGNYDSFEYLGLGVLLGVALLLFYLFLCLPRLKPFGFFRRHGVLLVVCACLTVFAISNVITADGAVLFTVPIPAKLTVLASTFRASGRLFWPVYYLLLLTVYVKIYQICGRGRGRFACILLVAVQLWDISPALMARHDEISNYVEEFPTELTSTFWELAAEKYDHIVSMDYVQSDALHLALYAVDHNMTTNDPFAARYDSAALENAHAELMAELAKGNTNENYLYLFSTEYAFLNVAAANADDSWCGHIVGKNDCNWYVIAPGMEYSGPDAVVLDDDYPFHISTYSDENWDEGVLLWDNQTVLFPAGDFVRGQLEGATALQCDGKNYPITQIDDKDVGWLMVTLNIQDAHILQGKEIKAVK